MELSHATPSLLAAYADGALSEGMSLLVASHLTFCPACRQKVAAYEALGGALLASERAAEAPALEAVLSRLDAPTPTDGTSVASDTEPSLMPTALREAAGAHEDAIRWRFLMPGLSEHRLSGFPDEDVRLLRARPGVRILSHTHVGEEATLVLSGAMRDGERIFRRGDVALADQSDDHHPQIVGDEVCLCLIVLSGRMRFTGPIGRALNIFNG